jgi:hypothetical protein
MDPATIVGGVQAAILLANYVQSIIALHQAGIMTDQQLLAGWQAIGVSIKADDEALQASEDASRARQMARAAQPVTPVVDTSLATTPR